LTGISAVNVLLPEISDWSTGFFTGISAEYGIAAWTFLTGSLDRWAFEWNIEHLCFRPEQAVPVTVAGDVVKPAADAEGSSTAAASS
jgi:hypothetical protein